MYIAIIIVLNALVYYKCLSYGLVSDDAAHMKLNPYNVKYDKTLSLLIHTLSCIYLYIAFGSSTVSFIAALLFSVHPLGVQIPVWKGGQTYGSTALSVLMAIALAPYGVLTLLLVIPGIPTAPLTPLLFLFTKYWYLAIFCPILICTGFRRTAYIIGRKVVDVAAAKEAKAQGITKKSVPRRGVLQEDFNLYEWKWINLVLVVKTFGYYVLASLFPFKNGYYNSFMCTLGSSTKATKYWYSLNRHFWGGLFAMSLMATIWWFHKFDFIGMGIMLFVLSLLPFMNFISIQQFTASRYAYLALAGFQIALVGTLSYLPWEVQLVIYGGLFIRYITKLFEVLPQYRKNDMTLIQLNSQMFPDNPRVWYFRYEHQLFHKNYVMAFAEATYGLQALPEDCQLWFGMACASYHLNSLGSAKEFLDKAREFMILADRANMKCLIDELDDLIDKRLRKKWR